jgi:hypothetical protein
MSEDAQLELRARHLLLCQQVLYDPFVLGAAFSLRGLLVSLQPNDDIGYPFTSEEIAVFAQLFGDAGDYRLWIDLVEIGGEDEADTNVFSYGPFAVRVRPNRFVEGMHVSLRRVPFPRPGIYEFRLRRENDEPLAVERLLLKE